MALDGRRNSSKGTGRAAVQVLGAALMGLLMAAMPLAAQRKLVRLPDIPGYLTLKCDFHIHTMFSDGMVWPIVRINEAWRDGLDVLAITDHVEYNPHKDYVPVNLNAAWEIAGKYAEKMNVILVHGAEITREMPPGHLNALFIKDASKLAQEDFMAVIKEAVSQGAFIQYNHPGWKAQQPDGIPKLYPVHRELLANHWLNGVEYVNGNDSYPLVLDWCRDYKLAMMGNSDCHEAISDIYTGMHRPMTLVFAAERTEAAVRKALFAGRTAVWYGDNLAGFREFTEPFFYAAVKTGPVFHSDAKSVWFEVRNESDVPFHLIKGPVGAPAEVDLPAGSVVVVKAGKSCLTQPLAYEVGNVIIGRDQNLAVKIAPAK